MINKVTDSLAQAFSGIQDGAVVMIGGFGGSGIGGNLYVSGNVVSLGGNPLHNIQVTINDVPPAGANIGDIWYDSESGASYQFISDGTSTFWIQFGTSF